MGAYTLLQDLTVSSNSTSVVLDDFGTITKDDFVKVVFTAINTVATFTNYALTANSSVTSNYHHQLLRGAGTNILAQRINNASVFFINQSTDSQMSIAYLKLSENNRMNVFSTYNHSISNPSTSLENGFVYSTSSGATFTSGITSLTLTAVATNGIGTGSRIQIYKLAAEKVADITVTSNTTQVDISNLSIDKDSEYLLVSDVTNASASTGTITMTPNDLTTLTNYFTQRIIGDGSSASSSRRNDPAILGNLASTKSLSYTHIKLSNIGAYTHQSYTMLDMGTSNVFLINEFASSTSEAITSITKLNIKHSGTNAIAAGSRFTLYKLYE